MLTRQKRHEKFKTNQTGDDDLINFKINEFFQTEQLFGQYKKFDQKIEDQVWFCPLFISLIKQLR